MWLVAEIGSCHKGSKEIAYRMIYEAAQAGATHAKFQLGWLKDDKRYLSHVDERLTKAWVQKIRHAPMNWVEFLKEACEANKIRFFASVWSIEGLQAIGTNLNVGYKIPHQLNSDWRLIEACTRDLLFGKVYVSGRTNIPHRHIKGIYVTEGYPSYSVDEMPKYFSGSLERYWGYSSHAFGYGDAILAAARGAEYIEKHFTLNPADYEVRDHAFALTPLDFKIMADACRKVRDARFS